MAGVVVEAVFDVVVTLWYSVADVDMPIDAEDPAVPVPYTN